MAGCSDARENSAKIAGARVEVQAEAECMKSAASGNSNNLNCISVTRAAQRRAAAQVDGSPAGTYNANVGA